MSLITLLAPRKMLKFTSNLAAAASFDPTIALSAGAPTPQWTVTMPDGTVETSALINPVFTIKGTGTTRCTLGPRSLYRYITSLDSASDGLTMTWTARELVLMPNLTVLQLSSNTAPVCRFDLGDLRAGMTYLGVSATLSVITGAIPMSALGLLTLYVPNVSSMTQANVDNLLLRLYTDRALFTGGTLTVTIDGVTGNPSGVYQDATPPTTGLEYAYALVVDPLSDHTKVFVVTY